jgi:hypothetical protein
LKIAKVIGTCFGIAVCSFLLLSSAVTAVAQVSITANTPAYNFQVLPGSTRQINVNIAGGTINRVNWSVLSTTGGAYATLTTPSATQVSSIASELPTVQVNIGSGAGTCSISGSIGAYTVSSTATVTVQAQSVDDTSKTAKILFNVCAKTTNVIVAPAYQQAYKSQHRTIQSWVSGDTDETGTWSIVSQPSGGNAVLADTTNRDADFVATVTGRYTLKYTSNSNSSQSATAIVYVSPNSMPSYAATPNGTEPRECYVDPALTGGDYEVGAGKAYTTIQSTPAANQITAGSIIRIWNTDTTGSNPSTYHENYQVNISGTPTQPMLICGVPDSHGNLPIVDGSNATMQAGLSTGAAAGFGVISTWGGGYGNGTPYGYWQGGSAGPSYVDITGLHIRNATPAFTYTPPGGGAATAYITGASCLNIRSGSYIDLSGNDLDTCTNGIFTAENTNSAWAPVTQEITIVGNHIHGSGWASDSTEHQLYLQSFYTMMQGNRVDQYLSTATGSNLKFRGVEGIFRYNYLGLSASGTNGPAREVDLVENQDAAAYVTFEQYLSVSGQTNCNYSMWCLGDTAGANVITAYQESAQKDFVYGNILLTAGAAEYQIHYSEDHDGGMAARNGTLYFFNNTMDNAEVIFDTSTLGGNDTFLQPRITATNNIFWNPGQIAFNHIEAIILTAATNLAKTGTFSIATPIAGGSYNAGTAFGWMSGCDYACQWPLSNPINTHLYGLTSANYLSTATQPYDPTTFVPPSGSAAISAGTAPIGPMAVMPVRWQYSVTTGSLTPRVSPLTIGAEDPISGGSSPAKTATPTFSPAGGTYSSAQTVTISTTSASATIYYTTDGTTPTSSSSVYSSPITVSATETVQAIAIASGSTSAAGSASYTITPSAPAPAFSLAPGTYTSAQTVSITTVSAGSALSSSGSSTTPSITIYYTTNGTTPTASSTVYSTPITVASTETLQAIAMASGYAPSVPVSATYTISSSATATPAFNPAGGTYTSTQTVTIATTTPSATIYYTTNGSTPTTSSPVYSGPITVSATETLKAIAVASGSTASAPGSATYTINSSAAATPAFNPAGGTYTSAQTVTISTTTPSATIYYTTNGSTPTTSSSVYSGAITVSATETLNAIAVVSGSTASAPGSATYTINSQTVASPSFIPAAGTYASTQTVTLVSALHGETIYYTTNGSTPTTSSSVYSGPITVSATETITAIGTVSGYSNSAPASATYTITPAAAKPTFSPAGGTYTSAQRVVISTTTPSATIYYTTNGSTPTTSSPVYSEPITVSTSETVSAIAVASGSSASTPGSATYTINLAAAATPTFSPAGGTYASTQTVTIGTTTPSATIYYTTNGSTPTTSSPVYSGAITVSASETLSAIAVASGSSTSATGSASYTINLAAAGTPTFSPAGGTYTSAQTVTIGTTTPSATIYYTTNGSTPTTGSPVYAGAITVSASETLKAIAVASGSSTSTPGSATYTISLPAATPTFSPAGGTYSSAQTVAIGTSTASATIYYTTNGSTPTTSSPVYSGAITVSASETLKAIAVASGSAASTPGSATYTINLAAAATPTFSPAGGTYASAQTVTIGTSTASATIYYTTNGSTPTTSSPVYSGAITVSASETLKAIAVASGSSASTPGSASYTISLPAATPVFSPAGGTYTSAQTVSIGTSTASATIYYTTNGSTPTTSSPVYSGAITVSASETLKAIAVASGSSASTPGSATYTISLIAATPTFSPAGGTYTSAQTVSIGTSTASATIHYTTNGSTPTTSSSVYSGPITISTSETLKAIAVASGSSVSAPASATYTINLPASAMQSPTINPAGGTYSSTQRVKISAEHKATIYYTTNGSVPTTSSPVYSGSITVSASETLKAIAVASGYSPSAPVSATFTIAPPAPTPSFSVAPGTYSSAQRVAISATVSSSSAYALAAGSTTPSVTIYYTTNGTTPTTSSLVYREPITVSASETVMAIAVASGYSPSSVALSSYTINVAATAAAAAAPTISPVGGSYTSAQTVKISAGSHWATIYYTTNGTTPTTSSPVYTGPITVAASETVQAIAVVSGYSPSAPVAASYTIGTRASDSPSFSVTTNPAAITLAAGQSGTATVFITPQNGFASDASLSCSGLPAGTTCDFSPATVSTSGAPVSSTLTLATASVNVASRHDSNPLYPGSALALSLCFFGRKRRRSLQLVSAGVAMALGLGLCTGCGVAKVTPLAVTSTINVIATHGTLQPATSITLTVL